MAYSANTVAILGLGLIGGSLARALRQSGFSQRFMAYGPREPSLRRGVEMGVVDSYTLDIEEVLEQADIIVVCTPTLVAADMLRQLLPRLGKAGSGPVVTDAASVKGNLRDVAVELTGTMPPQLVLGHPIAGSEHSGVEASRADLFLDHRVILTPAAGNDPAAVELVRNMWASTGAEVVEMGVNEHDAVLAATSHLPHLLAYALVDALAQSEVSEDIFGFAAGGFRDFTRIASSDPVMWRDIAIANRDALLGAIDSFSAHLGQLRTAVQAQDAEQLFATFSRAKQARDHFAAELAARKQSTAQE
jgi:cyclohexadieny/prephenate dehydrogenase